MADVLTPEQRRRCMAAIKGKDTKPELVVRSMAHSLGYRFRLHRKDLPGKPDLVFPRLEKIILVHGCYWHTHNCRFGRVTPKTNAEFWRKKREGNVKRDHRNLAALRRGGWKVLIIWECQTHDKDRLARRIHSFLKKSQH